MMTSSKRAYGTPMSAAPRAPAPVAGHCCPGLHRRHSKIQTGDIQILKEIEENNRIGKTRELFKKIRDIKGIFHEKMRTIKDRNSMDLTEAEDTKKRWQEYTEELYKKDLHDPDNHDGVITGLETDILECEVKWALGSITTNKASGDDGIPVELFQILKDDAVKVMHSICQQIWKTAVATGLEKVSFHSNPKERQCQRMFKLLHNYTDLTH